MRKSDTPVSVERRQQRGRRVDDQAPDFRDLVENAVEGVLVHRNFRPLYANQAISELFGYAKPKEILALPILRSLFPDDCWPRMEQDYDDLIRGLRPSFVSRARGLRKDGREIWIALTQRAIDWHGAPAVAVTAFDISAQMAVEHALLQNEQHLRSILEILPQPIYIARSFDGQLLYVNRKTCLLFQQRASQLLHGKAGEFFVEPKERDDLAQLFATLHDIRDVEVRMKNPHGREFIVEMAAIAVEFGGDPAILVALNDISHRKQMESELFFQASTDSLTGIANRRHFLAQAEQEMRRSRRFARDMAVMMIDIDHFKAINDQNGHAVGDAVLQALVKRALESLRQSDILGRLGGEEFAVILPETNLAAATASAERLRQHIAKRSLIAEHNAIACTVSIGVAQLHAGDSTIDDLLNRADEALYRAKNEGRNRVETAA